MSRVNVTSDWSETAPYPVDEPYRGNESNLD